MEYKSNNNVVYSCKYHVVFCPKYRRSVLINGVDVRLKELIQQTCEQLNVEIIEMEIMPDHVHLLINPAYTSQTCPKCGHVHHANDRNYTCKCGFHTHRDLLGAMNIEKSTEFVGNRQTA